MSTKIPRDRLDDDKVEVTPSMIEAGASVLRMYATMGADFEDLADLTFEAMMKVREEPD